MSDSELGYKLTYAMVLFLIFLHIFFLIFFTESKIRLSSKFRTSFWKQQITGVQFDKILYLEAIDPTSNCSEGYHPYPIAKWPGTTQGIHLKEHQFKYPCKMILNKMENISDYRLIETYSSAIGDLYSKYIVDTPFDNLCYDKKGRCNCPEQIFTYRKFEAQYPNHKKRWKGNDRIENISQIEEIPLSKRENKTFCSKNVTDFALFDESCVSNGGVECNGICIKGESTCPDYSSFRDSLRLKNKLISDFTIDYKRFPCSALNKLITYTPEYPLEFNHSLSNYRKLLSKDKNNLNEKCLSNSEFNLFEDIVLVDRLPIFEIYNNSYTGIDSKLKQIDVLQSKRGRNEHSFIDKFINKNKNQIIEEQEYFNIAGITHFEINKRALDCPKTLIKDINSSFMTAKKISQVNVTSINLLEIIYIYCLCYLFYKHFKELSKETKPEQKFYYVKFILLATFFFFCLNFLVYYSNREYKGEIMESIKNISNAIDHKCYSSAKYNNHLNDVMIRLKQFSTLSFLIYENLLLENISAMVLIILVLWSKVPLFEIFRIQKALGKTS